MKEKWEKKLNVRRRFDFMCVRDIADEIVEEAKIVLHRLFSHSPLFFFLYFSSSTTMLLQQLLQVIALNVTVVNFNWSHFSFVVISFLLFSLYRRLYRLSLKSYKWIKAWLHLSKSSTRSTSAAENEMRNVWCEVEVGSIFLSSKSSTKKSFSKSTIDEKFSSFIIYFIHSQFFSVKVRWTFVFHGGTTRRKFSSGVNSRVLFVRFWCHWMCHIWQMKNVLWWEQNNGHKKSSLN